MKRLLFTSSLLLGIFANAQISSIKENFEGAVLDKCDPNTCPYADFPYNGWTSSKGFPYAFITMNSKQTKYVKAYSFFSSDPIYFFTPELVSTEGNLRFIFNGSEGKLEVGTIVDKNDFSTFSLLAEYNITRDTNVIVGGKDGKIPPVEIKKNEAKYIAFKFVPAGEHKTFGLSVVHFDPKTLSTNDFQQKSELKFAIDLLNNKLIFNHNDIKSVKILTANGSLAANEKITNNSIDISKFVSGVYFIIAENELGNTYTSKFTKN